MHTSRRSFLNYASLAAAGNALGLRPFGALNALAETSSDYKALVCVFLFGGNDSSNMLVPFDTPGYASYSKARGPLALAQSTLLQLAQQPNFALHPSIPEVQSLFNGGNAAFIANVGTLVAPLTRAQYQSGSAVTPFELFSHPDQEIEWQNQSQTSTGASGWAGRVADQLSTQYNPGSLIPMISSLTGNATFCNGINTSPLALGPSGPATPNCYQTSAYCSMQNAAAQQIATLNSSLSMIQADNVITSNAKNYNSVLGGALQSLTSLQTQFPGNPLGGQLNEVAQMIRVRDAMGLKRQIFFVSVGNFDTHAGQLGQHASGLAQMSAALGAFELAMQEMGMSNNVTTFTCSDFGRTLQANSAGGSDHGWGGHHLVMGGAVKGGNIYGTFPTLAIGGPDDADNLGRLIPTTSAAQYAATLASWFGVQTSDLAYVLPTLGNFATSNLGFMG